MTALPILKDMVYIAEIIAGLVAGFIVLAVVPVLLDAAVLVFGALCAFAAVGSIAALAKLLILVRIG